MNHSPTEEWVRRRTPTPKDLDGPFVDGFRAYHCVAHFADGSEQRATLLADRDGNWQTPTN